MSELESELETICEINRDLSKSLSELQYEKSFQRWAYLTYAEVEEYVSRSHLSQEPSTLVVVNAPKGTTVSRVDSDSSTQDGTTIIMDARALED